MSSAIVNHNHFLKGWVNRLDFIYSVNQNLKKFPYVVIYGAGSSGQNLLAQLLCDDVYVHYFCDSDQKKWGEVIMGKKVISPKYLYSLKDEAAVLVSSIYAEEIVTTLTEKGMKNIYVMRKDLYGGI